MSAPKPKTQIRPALHLGCRLHYFIVRIPLPREAKITTKTCKKKCSSSMSLIPCEWCWKTPKIMDQLAAKMLGCFMMGVNEQSDLGQPLSLYAYWCLWWQLALQLKGNIWHKVTIITEGSHILASLNVWKRAQQRTDPDSLKAVGFNRTEGGEAKDEGGERNLTYSEPRLQPHISFCSTSSACLYPPLI